jgi:hypothetical protein
LKLRGGDPGASLDAVLAAACAAWDVDPEALSRAQVAPEAAYAALTRLLSAATDEADRRNA